MKKSDLYLFRFVKYIKRTWKIKLIALAVILACILIMPVLGQLDSKEGTGMIFVLFLAVCSFFVDAEF